MVTWAKNAPEENMILIMREVKCNNWSERRASWRNKGLQFRDLFFASSRSERNKERHEYAFMWQPPGGISKCDYI